jgi:ABC-type sulfate transport system permease component
MNRTLLASTLSSALGLLVGLGLGWRMNRKSR